MLAGKVPYRDTFPVHGFLSDGGLDFVLFSLWEPDFAISLRAHHLLGVLFQPALFLVTAALVRRVWLAILVIPLNLAIATALVADRPVLPLLGLAAFVWAIRSNPRRGRSLLAGTLTSMGFLYALEFGTFVLVAELVGLAWWTASSRGSLPPIRIGWFAAGLGVILLPFAVFLAFEGALLAFLRTSFLDLPHRIDEIWGWPFPAPWRLVQDWLDGRRTVVAGLPITLGVAKRLYLAPLAGAGGTAIAIWLRAPGRRALDSLRLLAASLACLLSFRYVIGRLHLEVGNALVGPVLVAVAVLLCRLFLERYPASRVPVPAAVGACAIAAVAMNAPARTAVILKAAAVYPARMAKTEGLVPLSVPRGGGVLVPEAEARELNELVGACDRWVAEKAPIVDLTNRPALFFFLRRSNASRFYQVPLMEAFESSVLADLRRSPPALAIVASGTPLDAMDCRSAQSRVPLVMALLEKALPRSEEVGNNRWRLPSDPADASRAMKGIEGKAKK